MTTKKLTQRQICLVESLSKFNFVFFYTQNQENAKPDLLTYRHNITSVDNYDDRQQILIQTILPPKRYEIGYIGADQGYTILQMIIQANIIEFHCMLLFKALEIGFLIEKINHYHFFDLSVNTNHCIHQLALFELQKNKFL